jgi:hypothetical protein
MNGAHKAIALVLLMATLDETKAGASLAALILRAKVAASEMGVKPNE